jgi:hypothetical protein
MRVIKPRKMRWAEHVAHIGDVNCIQYFGRKPTLKGRDHSEDGWEDDIRMDRKELGWEVKDWMHLAEDRRMRFELL